MLCVQEQNNLASDINTCIQLQFNCEYHNSEFSVYQFINNKYICLILPIKWTTIHTFMCLTRGVHTQKKNYPGAALSTTQTTCIILEFIGGDMWWENGDWLSHGIPLHYSQKNSNIPTKLLIAEVWDLVWKSFVPSAYYSAHCLQNKNF